MSSGGAKQYVENYFIKQAQHLNANINNILQKPNEFVSDAKTVYPSASGEFLDSLASRISSSTLTIHQHFNLIVYCDNAIDEIKTYNNFFIFLPYLF